MTVKIAGKPLNGAFGLSELARHTLRLIDGGLQWLEYALAEQDTHYHFCDDGALVEAVQTGLHATRYVLIDAIGLMVSPIKLMTMTAADLTLLWRAATGEVKPRNPDLVRLLAQHGLATQADLVAATTLLDHLEVADAPTFQAMGLDDRLILLSLSRDPCITRPGVPDLRLDAAAFGVAQAGSVAEFADYVRIYIDHVAAIDAAGDSTGVRFERVERAVHTLAPIMFRALDCPEVAGLVSPVEVETAIADWLMNGRQLGFLRVSQGVQQIVANTGYAGEDGLAAQLIVQDYLDRAQQLIRMQGIGRGAMGQDGATCLFPINAQGQEAVIRLGPTGVITLDRFAWQGAGAPAPRAGAATTAPVATGRAATPTTKLVRRRRRIVKK